MVQASLEPERVAGEVGCTHESAAVEDLFFREQCIYDSAMSHVDTVADGAPYDFERFRELALEYGRILKYMRRATRQSDLTARSLYVNNLDLLDKTFYDTVTGIYNRRFLEKMLGKSIRNVARSGGAFSFLMIDIDFFKKYNDRYGHGEGDTCLYAVAQALYCSISRGNDFVVRYGGEEFSVVLPGTGANGARVIAERALQAVRDLRIPHLSSEAAGHVTISVGAATVASVGRTLRGEDIVKRADELLYESKRNGRDRCTHACFEPPCTAS